MLFRPVCASRQHPRVSVQTLARVVPSSLRRTRTPTSALSRWCASACQRRADDAHSRRRSVLLHHREARGVFTKSFSSRESGGGRCRTETAGQSPPSVPSCERQAEGVPARGRALMATQQTAGEPKWFPGVRLCVRMRANKCVCVCVCVCLCVCVCAGVSRTFPNAQAARGTRKRPG